MAPFQAIPRASFANRCSSGLPADSGSRICYNCDNLPGKQMDKIKAERIIQAGLDRKADFVEIFEEETRNASVSFRDRKVESATAGTDYGVGIRMVYGTEVLYAHTSNDDENHIVKLIDNLARSRGIIVNLSSAPTVKLGHAHARAFHRERDGGGGRGDFHRQRGPRHPSRF